MMATGRWWGWLVSWVVLFVFFPPTSCHSGFHDDFLAVPVFEASPTINVLIAYTVDLTSRRCVVSADGGAHKDVAAGTTFQIPEISSCVWFKCTKRDMRLASAKTGCHYGNECLNESPSSEGRQFWCVKYFKTESRKMWSADRTQFNRTRRILVGFTATPPSTVDYTVDRKARQCTVGDTKITFGKNVHLDQFGECVTFKCNRRGLLFRSRRSKCVGPKGCATRTKRGCTRFTCIQAKLGRTSRGAHQTLVFRNSWVKLDPPSCKPEGECLLVGESRTLPDCREKSCVPVKPGLPDAVSVPTGCSLEPHDDGCLGLDQTSALFPPTAGGAEDACVQYACVQEPVDSPWAIKATRYTASFGCYHDGQCYPAGAIKELEDCRRMMCQVNGTVTTIGFKDGCKADAGDQRCRDVDEKWRVEGTSGQLGQLCTCKKNLSVVCRPAVEVTATTTTETTTTTSTTNIPATIS